MSINMTIEQAATVLNAVVAQQTGVSNVAPITNTEQFVSVAQTALKTGYDPVINAISQVWARTVYAVRPYRNPLETIRMSADRYGNALRKLSPVAKDMQDDKGSKYPVFYDSTETVPLGNGQSVDPWKLNKQEVLQTNFYGSAVYQQEFTIFKDQFDVAFSSPEEFVRFNQTNLTERMNDRESFDEAKARGLQLNFIAALLDEAQTDRVVHLLTEYNSLTGQNLTATTVMQAANFEAFIRWMYSRIRTLVGLMRARSEAFQTVITGKRILRHSEPENVRVAMYRPFLEMISSMVLSNLFNADMMRLPTYEAIDYWQSIETPQSISVTPVYTDSNGAATTGNAVSNSTVIGLIHDRDALGYAILNNEVGVSPYNQTGRYWNEAYYNRFRTIQDNTEKAIVLCLD